PSDRSQRRAASARAVARPIPLAAPVTTATALSRLRMPIDYARAAAWSRPGYHLGVADEPVEQRERVGYWSGDNPPTAPGLPDPREHVDRDWPLPARVRAANYPRRGEIVDAYLAYSY